MINVYVAIKQPVNLRYLHTPENFAEGGGDKEALIRATLLRGHSRRSSAAFGNGRGAGKASNG